MRDDTARPWWRWVLLALAFVVAALASVGLFVLTLSAILPPAVPEPISRPAATYDDAVARVEVLKSRDDSSIAYGTRFFGQGSQTTTAVVIFHGYTNNPKQFDRIAKAYERAGYNVLVPRIPGHGKRDVMADGLSEVTPDVLVQTVDESIDIAAGLGEHVQVVGLSGGGTMALWAAANRDEIDRVVAVAPLMLPLRIPSAVVKPITIVARVIPDIHLWWDDAARRGVRIPPHGYPKFSIRSIAAFLDLSFDLTDRRPRRAGSMEDAVLIKNEADMSVDIGYADKVFDDVIKPLSLSSSELVLSKSHKYAHDLIDPEGENAKKTTEIYRAIYPVLGLPPEGQ